MGYDFFDIDGTPCNSERGGRVVGLTSEDLTRIGTTIAIVAEDSKTTAILSALRTGAVDISRRRSRTARASIGCCRTDGGAGAVGAAWTNRLRPA